jgi:hypothetical protein
VPDQALAHLKTLLQAEAIMTKKSLRKLLVNLLAATILACSWSGSVIADGDRVEALEARIAELESLVHQLLQNHQQPSSNAATVANEVSAEEAAEARGIAELDEYQKAEQEKTRKHSYAFGGYIKADLIYSDYGGGSVAAGSAGRDFYIPSTVPVGNDGESYLDLHAKESRIHFRSDHRLDNGASLGTYLEMDFLMAGLGDERVSNSYNPRLRQAFLTYNKWLFGQAWVTLFNLAALPENLDFVGPSEATIFGRQVMIRYTTGPWQFALENPETTITPYSGGDRIIADDNLAPDAVVRYNFRGDWSGFTAAGILRQLAYENDAAGIDDTTTAYGISLSGKFMLGEKDDFRWMASTGKGLGRYIGLNTVNGAVLDQEGNLHTIDSSGIFGSYRHFWNEKWRSNLTLAYLAVDNDVALTGMGATKNASSVHINLIYSPQPKLDFGIEFLYADREIESGTDGDLARFQFSAKYAY